MGVFKSLPEYQCLYGLEVDCLKFSQYICDITKEDLKAFFGGNETSNTNKRNILRVFNEVLRFAKQESYLSNNPVDRLSDIDKALIHGRNFENKIEILTLEEANNLLNEALKYLQFNLFNSFVVQLFCEVRSEEVSKLTWKNIDTERNLILIPEEVAKKGDFEM